MEFLETGKAPEGLFADDVFCDFTLPHWRLQAVGIDGVLALRAAGHPGPSAVVRSRLDETSTGFVLEVEERWSDDADSWYRRELFRTDADEWASRTSPSTAPETGATRARKSTGEPSRYSALDGTTMSGAPGSWSAQPR